MHPHKRIVIHHTERFVSPRGIQGHNLVLFGGGGFCRDNRVTPKKDKRLLFLRRKVFVCEWVGVLKDAYNKYASAQKGQQFKLFQSDEMDPQQLRNRYIAWLCKLGVTEN